MKPAVVPLKALWGVALAVLLVPALLLVARLPGDEAANTGLDPESRTPMRYGVDVEGLPEVIGAGGVPAYAMVWAGEWSGNGDGWKYIRQSLRDTVAANVTPVVQWYYWGGDLSRSTVENGGNGKSVEEWFRYARTLATLLKEEARGRPAIVVLETEFNHPGIVGWQRFDELLADQARLFHEHAPGTQVALGFGSWDYEGWSTFPRAVAACDLLGFQLMRGVEREGEAGMRSLHLAALVAAHELRARFPGKPLFLDDIAVTTYGSPDGEALQAEGLRRLLAASNELRGLGVVGMVYRGVRDVPSAPDGYYGEGEKHFGLKRANGTPKEAWSLWLAALRENA